MSLSSSHSEDKAERYFCQVNNNGTALTVCLLFAYNSWMRVAGIPSRCLSFTSESLVPCRQPVRKLGSAELCDGSMRYRMRSRGIRNGKSLEIPKGPDGI